MNSSRNLFMNTKGMTLVELLAVLLITSLLALLLWTSVMLVIRNNIYETKKVKLQQEANYVISEIQNVHRYCDQYRITINSENIILDDCSTKSKRVISNEYKYSGTLLDDKQIDAKTKDASYKINLIFEDPENSRIRVDINTIISRYKSN